MRLSNRRAFWVVLCLCTAIPVILFLRYAQPKTTRTVHFEQVVQYNWSNATVNIYIEQIDSMDRYYGNSYTSEWEKTPPDLCLKAENATCKFQHNVSQVDVVYRQAQMYHHRSPQLPFRYCDDQIVATLNSETEMSYFMPAMQKANIRIDYHIESEITITNACGIPWNADSYKTPNVKGRKGVALLMSNCNAEWRTDYIREVMDHIHVYSYGQCFHNVEEPSSRESYYLTFMKIASKHRMVITFENAISRDYISEKIVFCYQSGVIPVYWGPPEIYQWVPGNHSFIDPQKFKGPKELAEYLKRVDEDDDLFRYHTTNFNYTLAKRTHTSNCIDAPLPCRLCKLAHDLKMKRMQEKSSTTCMQQLQTEV